MAIPPDTSIRKDLFFDPNERGSSVQKINDGFFNEKTRPLSDNLRVMGSSAS